MNRTSETPIYEALHEFIVEKDHPCLMAQSLVKNGNFRIREYEELGSKAHSSKLLGDIGQYLAEYDFSSPHFNTFIAAFQSPGRYSEKEFEKRLWRQLQLLHDLDTEPWSQEVEADPESTHFSFSLLGHAFYVVGMHPGSSRLARQSPRPMLVFNLHSQFERLRQLDAYEQTRSQIRERDTALQGYPNPMLQDFGLNREATQYSGRQVGPDWKCPFHATNRPTNKAKDNKWQS